MIKQIQLRGISHKPSDRGTHDGGLEDCIDLRLEEQEQAPATAPENVTDDLAPGLSTTGLEVLFIHKTSSYTNYIGVTESSSHLYLYGYYKPSSAWTIQQIVQLPEDEYPKGITSIGNIVMVTTSGGMMYILYHEGSYEYLGNKIPELDVNLRGCPLASSISSNSSIYLSQKYPNLNSAYENDDPIDLWEGVRGYLGQTGNNIIDEANAFYNDVVDSLWASVDTERKTQMPNDVFLFPVLARYALKLYDGSYIYPSSLILLSGGTSNTNITVDANRVSPGGGGNEKSWRTTAHFQNPYTATVKIATDSTLAKWKDIVNSVDIFISTDISVPKYNAKLGDAVDSGLGDGSIVISFDGEFTDAREGFEEQIKQKGNFYKVASIPWEQASGKTLDLVPKTQDDLVVLPRLPESVPHIVSGIDTIRSYNNRLILCGSEVILSSGYMGPNCWENASPSGSGTDMAGMVFFVRTGDGIEKQVFSFKDFYTDGESHVRAFVSYPDARCYKAYYFHKTSGGNYYCFKLPMKEHPMLNCAYGFWGLDSILGTEDAYVGDDREDLGDLHSYAVADDRTYETRNMIYMSETDNPFAFSLGQQMTFGAEILDALPVTTALSTSQFGQFPLYVFTEDGIWTISLNDEGGIAASHPVSRDVAVKGTIAQLDQAIVFVSAQGVMMLSGSQIVCLSPYMQGRQFTLQSIAPEGCQMREALVKDGWGMLMDIHIDETDFQKFVENCKPLYDYGNKRILFFKDDEDYAYDYSLDTQTWSKVTLPVYFERVLNGYPDALGVFGGQIYSWSVRPDYNDADPVTRKGLIVTRPFDLGEPDIRKAIKSIRIRGNFNHGDVRYMLLGSMNGIQWRKLLSLRGGSYKSFRMVIFANLAPNERISWIDIDYEGRFGDKLR